MNAGHVADEQVLDRHPQERLAVGLRAARAECDAAEDQLAVVGEKGVVLRLVREHRGVATVELELDHRGEEGRHLGHHALFVVGGPRSGNGEVDAVGIGLEQASAARRELRAHQLEHGAAPARDLVRGVDIGKSSQAAGAEIAVGGVDDELHRGRHRLVGRALRRARRCGAAGCLRGEPPLDEAIDECEHRAEGISRRPDPERAHQRWIQARDVGLDDPVRHTRGEQVQRGTRVRRAIARRVRGQRGVRAEIGAHEQRIDHAGRRACIREPLVAPRCHPCERERGTAEEPREAGDLLDVGGGVAAHAIRIALVDGVDLIAAHVLAVRTGEAEVTRDRLEAVAREIAGREVVPKNRVQRIDQLAARCDEPHPPAPVDAARHAAARTALSQPRRSDPAEIERYAEQLRAAIEERQIEAMQVVVLDHVGVGCAHNRDQPRDQRCLVEAFDQLDAPVGIAHGDHEDPIALRIETCRLEIDLHPT